MKLFTFKLYKLGLKRISSQLLNISYPISFHGKSINSCAKAAKLDVTGLIFLATD